MKSLFLLPLLALGSLVRPDYHNSGYFIMDKGTILGIKEEHINDKELRIYNEGTDLTISMHVFDAASELEVLMLTYAVKEIEEQNFSDSLTTINFTGGEEEYKSLDLPDDFIVNYYSNDEGFIYYWDLFVRENKDINLCDSVDKDLYKQIVDRYEALSNSDKEVVDNYVDKAGSTIKSSLAYLKGIYGEQESRKVEKEISSSLMITLILVTAIIGMTFIAIMYFLKDKKIIN